MTPFADHADLLKRIERELTDGYDEELELEIEDRTDHLAEADGAPVRSDEEERLARQVFFKELFRLQAELVKLQDWVATTRQKVVVLFEGRDAAGRAA